MRYTVYPTIEVYTVSGQLLVVNEHEFDPAIHSLKEDEKPKRKAPKSSDSEAGGSSGSKVDGAENTNISLNELAGKASKEKAKKVAKKEAKNKNRVKA